MEIVAAGISYYMLNQQGQYGGKRRSGTRRRRAIRRRRRRKIKKSKPVIKPVVPSYKFIYVDYNINNNLDTMITNENVLDTYETIVDDDDNDRWGIFLLDSNEIIGASHVYQTEDEDDGAIYSNIVHVYIDDNYRGKRLCSMIVEKLFKVLGKKNYGDGVIETVIAGGIPVLKCFLRVADKLNYNIYSVPVNNDGDVVREQMELITAQKALELQAYNSSIDEWQRLRFVKK